MEKFEALLEHEHLLGDRIFTIGQKISQGFEKVTAANAKAASVKRAAIPPEPFQAAALFVHLINHFADPVHLRAEEAMAEFAVGRGLSPDVVQWMYDQHEMARAYWAAITIAWRRISMSPDDGDRYFALLDFTACTNAFVVLFQAHAVRENGELYDAAAARFSDADDDLITDIISHSGPSVDPYVGIVERAEALLSIPPS